MATAMEATIKTPADLDRVAKEKSLTVVESPLVQMAEPIQGIGSQPELSGRLFGMKEGEVTGKMRVSTGWVFATVTGRQDAYIPKVDEVKTKVADDLKADKAADMARQRASQIATELKTAKDFAAAAKKYNLEVKSTELITRGQALPDLGISDAIDNAAFALPQGGVSDAIVTPQGTAIVRVVEKVGVTDSELDAGKDQLRDELVNARRDKYFGAYMKKAKTGLKITTREDLLAKITGA